MLQQFKATTGRVGTSLFSEPFGSHSAGNSDQSERRSFSHFDTLGRWNRPPNTTFWQDVDRWGYAHGLPPSATDGDLAPPCAFHFAALLSIRLVDVSPPRRIMDECTGQLMDPLQSKFGTRFERGSKFPSQLGVTIRRLQCAPKSKLFAGCRADGTLYILTVLRQRRRK